MSKMDIIKILKAMFLGPKPRLNIRSTIYFNFKVLPISQAFKLPLFLYGRWNLRYLYGRIIIYGDNIKCGSWKLGFNTAGYFSSYINTIALHKESVFHLYSQARVGQGVQICLYPKAIFELGKDSSINDNVKIICSKKIIIGNHTDLTWECQVTDFNSHYIVDKCTGKISNIINPVIIGDYCWICNKTSIMPGTILPNRTIVSSNSILNKDYVKLGIPERSLIGGSPAKLIKNGVYRIYNRDNEKMLRQYFDDNPDQDYCEIKTASKFEE